MVGLWFRQGLPLRNLNLVQKEVVTTA